MATQAGDKQVKLDTMIVSMEPIPWNTSRSEFAVQVYVTAPAVIPVKQSEAAEGVGSGVDLVAVLDISGGMNEDGRLERMKEAMTSIMGQLCPDDRLCILSFNDEVRPLMELCPMSDVNWAIATTKIEVLTAPAGGGANVKAATDAAAAILAQRGEEEQINRVGRVIFLSGGGDDEDTGPGAEQNTDTSGPEFSPDPASPEVTPPGAFVLGAGDSLSALSFGANNSSGAYTCVNDNVDKIVKDEAPDFTSVGATMGVQIDVHPQEGVVISSIQSGSGGNRLRVGLGPEGPRSITIYIQDLHAGEQKSFTVYLKVPEAKEELLAVTGWYSDPESGKEDIQLDVSEVFILRPRPLSHKVKMMGEKAITCWVLPCMTFLLHMVKFMGEKVITNPYSKFMALPFIAFLHKVKIMWEKIIRNPYSWGLPCIAFLLLGSMLYVGNLEDGRKMEEAGSGGDSVNQATTFRKMQDTRITSILQKDINRYIYQAFVPAQDVCPAIGVHVCPLEQTVQMLEAEEELRVMIQTLVEEKEKDIAAKWAPGKGEA